MSDLKKRPGHSKKTHRHVPVAYYLTREERARQNDVLLRRWGPDSLMSSDPPTTNPASGVPRDRK